MGRVTVETVFPVRLFNEVSNTVVKILGFVFSCVNEPDGPVASNSYRQCILVFVTGTACMLI
jgi:hypothetical protein